MKFHFCLIVYCIILKFLRNIGFTSHEPGCTNHATSKIILYHGRCKSAHTLHCHKLLPCPVLNAVNRMYGALEMPRKPRDFPENVHL